MGTKAGYSEPEAKRPVSESVGANPQSALSVKPVRYTNNLPAKSFEGRESLGGGCFRKTKARGCE
jgi:hypothetical protein